MKRALSFACLAVLLALACAVLSSCAQDDPSGQKEDTPAGGFAKGADVSWLTKLESESVVFKDRQGRATECMRLLKEECGVDAIRLRVWVNPTEGWNNPADVLVKARRAAALGLRLMIDFHFSDTWADPGRQQPPAAWASYDLAGLKAAVAAHVRDVLTQLKDNGITPEWVQIGNETRAGMLWPLGHIDRDGNYAALSNAGYDAVKAVFPETKVVVHIDNGHDQNLFTYVFDYLRDKGGKYDVIGMSLYPERGKSADYVRRCLDNIASLASRYGKPVILCEFGMDCDQPEECRSALESLIAGGKESGKLEGVFYWEPEAPAGYNGGYGKGCFQNGSPTVALDAFKGE